MRTTLDLLEGLLIEAIDRGLDAMKSLLKRKYKKTRIFEPENGSLAYVICKTTGRVQKDSLDEALRLEQETLLKEDLRDAGFTA